MRCQLENVLVDCLRETLNVLVCSSSRETIRAVERNLKENSLYSVYKARNPGAMDQLLLQVPSWHVLVVDDQCPFAGEYLKLATARNVWVPTIVLTNSWSRRGLGPAMDFSVEGTEGAQGEGGESSSSRITCPVSNLNALLGPLQEWAIKRKLLTHDPEGLVFEAMGSLFKMNHLSVDDWSAALGVKPRRFQREFKQYSILSPKKILALYHAYRIAFSVINRRDNHVKGVIPAYLVDERSKARVMEYVLTHRSSLLTTAT